MSKNEEVTVVPEKGHKGLTALFFILFTIIVLGVLSIILIPKLAKKPIKEKTENTYEINSEVKYSDLVEVNKNAKLDKPDELVDTSKLETLYTSLKDKTSGIIKVLKDVRGKGWKPNQ